MIDYWTYDAEIDCWAYYAEWARRYPDFYPDYIPEVLSECELLSRNIAFGLAIAAAYAMGRDPGLRGSFNNME